MYVDFQDTVQALHHSKYKARYTWFSLWAVMSANHWKSSGRGYFSYDLRHNKQEELANWSARFRASLPKHFY
uniref:Uncharacterized protein n=1 Tax=Triticum urartu TaxID=4572 RepID=A0A8R7QDJ1_TRIUA